MKDDILISNTLDDVLGSRGRMVVLRTLINNPNLNIDQITKKSRVTRDSILIHLTKLIRANLVVEVDNGDGGNNIYRLNEKEARSKAVMRLFHLWEGSNDENESKT